MANLRDMKGLGSRARGHELAGILLLERFIGRSNLQVGSRL